MCLDVMRGIARQPEHARLLLADLMDMAAGEARLTQEALALAQLLQTPPAELEGLGRQFTARLAVLAQACLLRRIAPAFVAEAFIASRYSTHWGQVSGMLWPQAMDVDRLLARTLPV